jgi:peptidoglycan hydrolase CwlO-like protein
LNFDLKEKQDEINHFKRIIKDLEDEIARLKIEQQQNTEKDREFVINMEKLEKNLIREINDEQRKLSVLIPGLLPKLVNYSK